MKIATDHQFYAPVWNQLAEILDKDYIMHHDSTDSALDNSITVTNKKYPSHGLHISTYLGDNPEWSITAYYTLPVDLNYLKKYSFTPLRDDENFPILTETQLRKIKEKIKEIDDSVIESLEEMKDDLENGLIVFGGRNMVFFLEGGLDLRPFKKYGINIDYRGFLIVPDKSMKNNYMKLVAITKAKDPNILKLTNESIDMYLEELKYLNTDQLFKWVNKLDLNTKSKFNKENLNRYIDLIKSQYNFDAGYDFDSDLDGWQVKQLINMFIDNDDYVSMELITYFYKNTEDIYFLPSEVRDIFLF